MIRVPTDASVASSCTSLNCCLIFDASPSRVLRPSFSVSLSLNARTTHRHVQTHGHYHHYFYIIYLYNTLVLFSYVPFCLLSTSFVLILLSLLPYLSVLTSCKFAETEPAEGNFTLSDCGYLLNVTQQVRSSLDWENRNKDFSEEV